MSTVVLVGTSSGVVSVVARPRRTTRSNARTYCHGRRDTPRSKLSGDYPTSTGATPPFAVDPDARFAFAVERGGGVTDAGDTLTADTTLGACGHCHAESGAFDEYLDRLLP